MENPAKEFDEARILFNKGELDYDEMYEKYKRLRFK